jgi:septal ring factor EnvC (AmiA/AmiB activator)
MRNPHKWVWPIGLSLLLVSPVDTVAESLEEKLTREKAALDSLNTMLEKDREVLSTTEKQKVSIGSELDRLQRDRIKTKRDLRELANRERDLSQRVDLAQSALSDAEKKLDARESGIVERLRASYKLARQNPLLALLSESSLNERARRHKYLGKAAHQDRVDLAALAASREEVRKSLMLRQLQHTHQHTLVLATKRKEGRVTSTVATYDNKLRHIRREETLLKSVIREHSERLAEGQNRIQEIVQQMERLRLAGRRLELPDFDFTAKRGALPWPVRGEILTRFGRVQDPELGTWTMNRGVTIGADAGSDVLTIAPGEVMLVDWWRGYGQLVLLRHPDAYYTLYSHLESRSVEVGEILAEGALIGTVGSTGRLDSVPQLHFEIMKEEAVLDPTVWLAK